MPFKPGQSGNSKGRPKGALDKTSRKVKENIADFLLKNASKENLQEIFESLLPDERARTIKDFLKLISSPPPTISMNIDFEDLSQEQIEQIFESMPEKKLDKLIERIQQFRK